VLNEITFFGEVDKVKIAIDRLKQFEPEEGYYLAFSGGKDSVTIKALADMAGVKYEAHYNLTTVDPPELVRFIKEKHPDVIIDKPEKTMWRLIVEHGMPPTRIVRYCCEALKEGRGAGRRVLTGVRWAESNQRKGRRMVEVCMKDDTKTFLHPIIDWTDAEVWEFIKGYKVPYCELYDQGHKRLGCIMCPMKGTRGMLRDAEQYPKYYQAYMRAFARMVVALKERGREIQYKTAEDVMHWWIYNPPKQDPDQTTMFE
jgi:phosphoadenosine phosphosulfate reductase